MLNAAAFIGGNYLAKAFDGGDKGAEKERERCDKATEAYKAAYNKYTRNRTKILDWIATNARMQALAKQDFTNMYTDYAVKLYKQARHLDEHMTPPRNPKFSDFFQPSKQQKRVN